MSRFPGQAQDVERFDRELEHRIAEDKAKADPRVTGARCSVCGVEWVDVLQGQDTCEACGRE